MAKVKAHVETIEEFVERTRLASGVPHLLEDEGVADTIARLMWPEHFEDPPLKKPKAMKAASRPKRPRRNMASFPDLAEYHGLTDVACFRCGWKPPVSFWQSAGQYLDRAHVIDRASSS